jgi:hypothetical protein
VEELPMTLIGIVQVWLAFNAAVAAALLTRDDRPESVESARAFESDIAP